MLLNLTLKILIQNIYAHLHKLTYINETVGYFKSTTTFLQYNTQDYTIQRTYCESYKSLETGKWRTRE